MAAYENMTNSRFGILEMRVSFRYTLVMHRNVTHATRHI